MYNAQTTIQRVQSAIKARKVTQKEVLSKCNLSENTLKKMSDTNGMASFNLAKIADYLDVSVDYLLSRTDDPQAHKTQNTYTIQNRNTTVSGTQANVITAQPVDKETLELAQLIQSLPLVKRAEAVLAVEKIRQGK